MNYAKGHLLARDRIKYSFRTLVDRTLRERHHEERRLAEQRGTKHQFQARNSCILDGRNYRIARRLLLLARAQFNRTLSFSSNFCNSPHSKRPRHLQRGRLPLQSHHWGG